MRISDHRAPCAAIAASLLLVAGNAFAQYGPGVGADQLVLRDPATGNVFVLRAPSGPGTPASYSLELPNMTGVPAVAGILMTIDNSGATKKVTLIPPTSNSVLVTSSGAPFYSTTLPGGLTIPTPTITTPTITGGTMSGTAVTGGSINNTPIGNTTPSTGAFTNLTSTGNTSIATNPGSTAAVGNSTGTTTLDGQTITIGHSGGTTTLNGTVNFTNAPTIPLAQNNIWVGNASGNQQAYAPSPNSVLVTNNTAGGTPSWSTTLPGGLTIPTATITGATITGGSINNTPIGNTTPSTGAFTNLSATGTTALATTAGSAGSLGNNTGTTNVQGSTVNMGTSDGTPGAAGETVNNIGYNDGDGAGPSGPSTTNINGNTNIGSNTGNSGGPTTTTINGNVSFGGTVTLPLPQNNIYVGNASNQAQPYAPGANGSVLSVVGSTPTWSTTNNFVTTAPAAGGAVTNINTGDVNSGNNNEATTNIGYNDPDGATSTNAASTTNINGNTNIGSATGSAGGPTTTTINGTLVATGASTIASLPGVAANVGNTSGQTSVQGIITNIGTSDNAPTLGGLETTITVGYDDQDGSGGPSGPSTTNIKGNTNIGSNTGNNGGPTTTIINGNVSFGGTVTLPLPQNNIYVGNASNQAQPYAPGANGSVLSVVGSTPTWSTTNNFVTTAPAAGGAVTNINTGDVNSGNNNEATTNIGYNDPDGATSTNAASTTNINGNTNIGSNTGSNGGPTTTTINGNVVFANSPAIPLPTNAIFVGVANVSTPYNSTNVQGAVLMQNGSGTPVWSTANNFVTTAPTAGGAVTNINTGDVNSGNASEATTNIGYNDPDGATATNAASTTNINGNTNIGSATGSSNGPTTTTINGTLVATGASTIASTAGTAANVGNNTGATSVQGVTVNMGTSDANPNAGGGGSETTITLGYDDQDGSSGPSGPSITNIRGNTNIGSNTGNNGGPTTTTINGNVVFNTAPSIPLAQNAIFVGNGSNVAAPVNSTNVPGAVLVQNATGTPTWSTAAMLTSVAGPAPQTNINATDINNGSGTESNITIGYTDPDGSSSSNGPSTTNIRGDVNINTADPGRNTPQTLLIGYNDPDGAAGSNVASQTTVRGNINLNATNPNSTTVQTTTIGYNDPDGSGGPNVASNTVINGNVTLGNPANFRNALGLYNGTLTINSSNTVLTSGRWVTTVPQTAVVAGSQILVTWDDNTTNFPSYKVSGRSAGTNFTIDWSANPSGGSVHYFIINP